MNVMISLSFSEKKAIIIKIIKTVLFVHQIGEYFHFNQMELPNK